MENERSDLQASEPQPSRVYPRDKFIVLLIILIVLVVLIGAAQRIPIPTTGYLAFSEESLEGDIAMKLSYVYRRQALSVPSEAAQKREIGALAERQRRSAIASYQRAVRADPSPANMRRLIVIQDPGKRGREIERLAKAAGPRRDTAPEVLHSEIAMWERIYVSADPLTSNQVEGYTSRIRGLGLGWYEHLALADLFDRGGMPARAKVERAAASEAASRTVGVLVGLLTVLGLLGMAGVACLTWYVRAKRTGRLAARDADLDFPSPARSLAAGYLLETFVIYLVIVVGLQVAAGIAVAAGMLVTGALRPADAVLITAGVYILAGLLSALYLARRLRSAEASWKTVGLSTGNPLADVAWGLGGYAVALPLLAIAVLVSQVLSRYVQTPSNPIVPLFVASESLLGRLILLGLIVIAAPFFEELFFRGVLYNSFRVRWGVRLGIILSALVFAAVHPLPVGFLPIFVLGYILATLVHERGSLLPAIVTHGLNNTVAFIMLLILTET